MEEEIGLEGFIEEVGKLKPERLVVYGSLASDEYSKVSDEDFLITFKDMTISKLKKLRGINKKYEFDLFPLESGMLGPIQNYVISPIFVKEFNRFAFPLIGEKPILNKPSQEELRRDAAYFFSISKLPLRFVVSQHPSWIEDEEEIGQVVRLADWSLFGRARAYLSYKNRPPTSRRDMIQKLKVEGRDVKIFEKMMEFRKAPEKALGNEGFIKDCLKTLEDFDLFEKTDVDFEKPRTICKETHPLEELEEKDWVKSIVWYGSRVVGECREESDYDYLVIADELDYDKLKLMGKLSERFEKENGKLISILPYTLEELKKTRKGGAKGIRIGKLRFFKNSDYSLKKTYKVMYGYDIFKNLEWSKKEIRGDAKKEFILFKLKMPKKFVNNSEKRTLVKRCVWMARDFLFTKGRYPVTKEDIIEGLGEENPGMHERLKKIKAGKGNTRERCLRFAKDFSL